jgi:photosystem II stability/assembly factor-like uncharacterized protein
MSSCHASRRRLAAAFALLPALALGAVAVPAASATAGDPPHHRGHHHAFPVPTWRLTPTGSTEQFRGLDAVSRTVAWVAGEKGTVLRTVDGGRSWQDVSPDDSPAPQLRDIEALDSRRAVALAIGPGDASRIYRTTDGGRSWTRTFTNTEPTAFYDCLAFFDHRRGLALSDPVDGRFRILATRDGGRSWQVRSGAGMPPALAGEFAFAASGTCVTTAGPRDAWFATGGGAEARVFHSTDGGRSWTAVATPVRSTEAGGIFSLAFRDRRHGLAVGGDFLQPDQAVDALARTRDGGAHWSLVPAADAPGGYRSGSAWAGRDRPVALAVGPNGSDVSFTDGRRWAPVLDTAGGPVGFDSVACARDGACWASGTDGRVARLEWRRSKS